MSATTLHAQVTIGSLDAPQDFSILELISSNERGLRLPQLTTAQRDAVENSSAFQAEKNGKAEGLQIFNTDTKCVETWNGTKWISTCDDSCNDAPATPGAITLSPTTINLNGTFTASIATVPSATSYTWSLPSGLTGTSTTNSITITGATAGTYAAGTITVTATNACGTSAAKASDAAVTVNNCSAAPATPGAITLSSTSITQGSTFTASVSAVSGATSYAWTLPTGLTGTSTTNSITITATNTGTYAVGAITVTASNDCGTSSASASTGAVTVNAALNPATLPAGSGSLSGKTCFDINKSNFGGECGTQSARTAQAVDFATLGTVTYTFTKSAAGTVDNVRYVIVDNENCVTSAKSGTITLSGSTGTISVNYKTTLSETSDIIYERDRNAAAQVKIYVIYNNGTQDIQINLTAKIQDCICCGAYVAVGVWKEFMCHNLGADESLDPFTPAAGINGDYYQWGGNLPVKTMVNDGSNTAENGYLWGTVPSGYYGDGTIGSDSGVKSAYDPCPTGYRVPSYAEWNYLRQNNTKTMVPSSGWNSTASSTNWQGAKFGESLYLPAAGYRSSYDGALDYRGTGGHYWSARSSTLSDTDAYRFAFGSSDADMANTSRRTGISVRCIAE
jgi:uncharacterized protein (TIGR02145 family)